MLGGKGSNGGPPGNYTFDSISIGNGSIVLDSNLDFLVGGVLIANSLNITNGGFLSATGKVKQEQKTKRKKEKKKFKYFLGISWWSRTWNGFSFS